MIETTEKLLPCAHCDSSDVEYRSDIGHQWHFLSCTGCGHRTTFYRSKAEARAAWNRRAAEKPKWTTEPPTETGLYHLYRNGVIHTALITKSCTPDHPGYDENEVHILDGISFDYWGTIDEYLDWKWLKIDVPALPEEGGAT